MTSVSYNLNLTEYDHVITFKSAPLVYPLFVLLAIPHPVPSLGHRISINHSINAKNSWNGFDIYFTCHNSV